VALPVADPAGEVAGVVVLSRTPSSLADTIWGKRKPLIVLTLLLIAGGVALAAGISRLVTRPLRILVRRAQAVAAGEAMAIDPGRTGTREVAELSDAIARMARTLEQRAGYISGFAASVSHEFKTPMTAIRAAAELLDEHADSVSPEERRRLLGVVSDGVARLELLVRRLVELARADMTTRGEAAIAAVDPIVRRVAERYRQTGMTVAVTGAAGAARLPEDALDALMTTMLENAAAHATGAAVDIVVEADGDHVRITVRDDGPGTPPAHQVRAFEPFFTTARGQGGTGLGLPIVRAIVAGVGGSVTLLPTQAGAAFLISLPAAT
jgi:signal transduction histidine kinase